MGTETLGPFAQAAAAVASKTTAEIEGKSWGRTAGRNLKGWGDTDLGGAAAAVVAAAEIAEKS